MSTTVYICEACRKILRPDEQVVTAAQQIDVTTQGSSGREYIDGMQPFFHFQHWPGDSTRWKERGRGTLSSFVGT